jgi:hypothetical protein
MKYVFLATDDNQMQLYHLLLNAINFHEKGHEVTTVLECASPKILIGIVDGTIKLPIFDKAMQLGIIDHGVSLKGELNGHSDLLKFVDAGFSLLTF